MATGLLAIAIGLLLVAGPAPAGQRFGSTVTLRVEGLAQGVPTALHGRVRSAKPACVRARKVKVIRRNEGARLVYGRTFSDGDGRWRLEAPGTVPNGTYRALAASKRLGNGRCAKARSEGVFVD